MSWAVGIKHRANTAGLVMANGVYGADNHGWRYSGNDNNSGDNSSSNSNNNRNSNSNGARRLQQVVAGMTVMYDCAPSFLTSLLPGHSIMSSGGYGQIGSRGPLCRPERMWKDKFEGTRARWVGREHDGGVHALGHIDSTCARVLLVIYIYGTFKQEKQCTKRPPKNMKERQRYTSSSLRTTSTLAELTLINNQHARDITFMINKVLSYFRTNYRSKS